MKTMRNCKRHVGNVFYSKYRVSSALFDFCIGTTILSVRKRKEEEEEREEHIERIHLYCVLANFIQARYLQSSMRMNVCELYSCRNRLTAAISMMSDSFSIMSFFFVSVCPCRLLWQTTDNSSKHTDTRCRDEYTTSTKTTANTNKTETKERQKTVEKCTETIDRTCIACINMPLCSETYGQHSASVVPIIS